jgi:hypothetical protein
MRCVMGGRTGKKLPKRATVRKPEPEALEPEEDEEAWDDEAELENDDPSDPYA